MTSRHTLRLRNRLLLALALSGALACGAASASCLDGKRMMGTNLAGPEFNAAQLPGVFFKDFIYPDQQEMLHFHAIGMNTFRLPILWERLQPELFTPLNSEELHRVEEVVSSANAMNACVILDIHNYGEYRGNPIGSNSVPTAAYIDFWRRLSVAFPHPEDTAFGLMNEPSKLPIADWVAIAQQTLAALRKDGSRHLILVAGGRWSGAHDWNSTAGGVSNADAFRNFRDPAQRMAIEVHQYADQDFSGTASTCVDTQSLKTIMENVTHWAEASGHRLFLGEFGVPPNPECLQALRVLLDAVRNNPVWLGATYWAAGRWWGPYPLSIEPEGGIDKPQSEVLKKYMPL